MTDKLSGIKAGDRVRVTVEGYVYAGIFAEAGPVSFRVGFGEGRSLLVTSEEVRDGVMEVERIEKPLAVGDRVKDAAFGFGEGEILCVDDGSAFIRWNDRRYPASALLLSNLERIS